MNHENLTVAEDKLNTVHGGDETVDQVFEIAREYIAEGNAALAQQIYRSFVNEFTASQKQTLQLEFYLKFGYTIV